MGCSLFAQSRQLFGEVECNQTNQPDWWLMIVIFQLCFKLNQIKWMYSAWIIKYILCYGASCKGQNFCEFWNFVSARIRLLRMSLKIGSFVHTPLCAVFSSWRDETKYKFSDISHGFTIEASYTFSDTLWSKSCVLKGRQRTKSVQSSATIVVHFILRRLRLSLTRRFLCVLSSKGNIYLEFQIFLRQKTLTKKEIIMCYAPHLSGKKVTRDLSRGQRRKKGNLHIFLSTVGSIFSSSPIASLLVHINIIYIFTLLFWVEKLTQISTDDEYKAPQTWFSGVGNWVESFFSRSLSCIFFFYTWIQNGWNWLMVFFILLFLSSNFFLILNIFSDIYARMLYSFLISLLSPRDDDDDSFAREMNVMCGDGECGGAARYSRIYTAPKQICKKFAYSLLLALVSLRQEKSVPFFGPHMSTQHKHRRALGGGKNSTIFHGAAAAVKFNVQTHIFSFSFSALLLMPFWLIQMRLLLQNNGNNYDNDNDNKNNI